MTFFFDVRSLFARYLTKLGRNPTLLGTNLATPLLFLLLFSQLLQKLSSFPGVSGDYLTYLTPGIIVMISFGGATLSGVSIVNDLNSGFLSKMLLTQVNRAAILVGRLLTDVLVVMVQTGITLALAAGMGVRVATGFLGVLFILATAAAFELALCGIFLAIGMGTKKTETISALASVAVFPLLFISSAFFPDAFLPSWAQTVSSYNPVSSASDVMRATVQGGLTWNAAASAYAVIGAIALVTFSVTLLQFRRVIG